LAGVLGLVSVHTVGYVLDVKNESSASLTTVSSVLMATMNAEIFAPGRSLTRCMACMAVFAPWW
jgi:hypothetical protein